MRTAEESRRSLERARVERESQAEELRRRTQLKRSRRMGVTWSGNTGWRPAGSEGEVSFTDRHGWDRSVKFEGKSAEQQMSATWS